jgi:hypothetical protein
MSQKQSITVIALSGYLPDAVIGLCFTVDRVDIALGEVAVALRGIKLLTGFNHLIRAECYVFSGIRPA